MYICINIELRHSGRPSADMPRQLAAQWARLCGKRHLAAWMIWSFTGSQRLHSALQKFHSYKQIGIRYDQFPHWSIGWYRWYRSHGPWLEAFITYILGGVLALVIFAIPFLTSLKQSQTRVASWRQKKRPREGQNRSGDFEGEIHQSINGGTPKSSTIWLWHSQFAMERSTMLLSSVNHLFLWAIYFPWLYMAMLVITRGYFFEIGFCMNHLAIGVLISGHLRTSSDCGCVRSTVRYGWRRIWPIWSSDSAARSVWGGRETYENRFEIRFLGDGWWISIFNRTLVNYHITMETHHFC